MPVAHPIRTILGIVIRVEHDQLNFVASGGWETAVDISTMQNYCRVDSNILTPHEVTITMDWLVTMRIMAGKEPPPLGVLVYVFHVFHPSPLLVCHQLTNSQPTERTFESMPNLASKRLPDQNWEKRISSTQSWRRATSFQAHVMFACAYIDQVQGISARVRAIRIGRLL